MRPAHKVIRTHRKGKSSKAKGARGQKTGNEEDSLEDEGLEDGRALEEDGDLDEDDDLEEDEDLWEEADPEDGEVPASLGAPAGSQQSAPGNSKQPAADAAQAQAVKRDPVRGPNSRAAFLLLLQRALPFLTPVIADYEADFVLGQGWEAVLSTDLDYLVSGVQMLIVSIGRHRSAHDHHVAEFHPPRVMLPAEWAHFSVQPHAHTISATACSEERAHGARVRRSRGVPAAAAGDVCSITGRTCACAPCASNEHCHEMRVPALVYSVHLCMCVTCPLPGSRSATSCASTSACATCWRPSSSRTSSLPPPWR